MSAWGSAPRSSSPLLSRIVAQTSAPSSSSLPQGQLIETLAILPMKTFTPSNYETLCTLLQSPDCRLKRLLLGGRDCPPDSAFRLGEAIAAGKAKLEYVCVGRGDGTTATATTTAAAAAATTKRDEDETGTIAKLMQGLDAGATAAAATAAAAAAAAAATATTAGVVVVDDVRADTGPAALKEVDLSYKGLSASSCLAVGRVLSRLRFANLSSLDLSRNELAGGEKKKEEEEEQEGGLDGADGAAQLLAGVSETFEREVKPGMVFPSLANLTLSECSLTSRGSPLLSISALLTGRMGDGRRSGSLSLDLGTNPGMMDVDDVFPEPLMSCLRSLTLASSPPLPLATLRSVLSLSLSSGAAYAASSVPSPSASLTSLNLSGLDLLPPALTLLAAALCSAGTTSSSRPSSPRPSSSVPSLRALNVSNNPKLGSSGVVELCRALKKRFGQHDDDDDEVRREAAGRWARRWDDDAEQGAARTDLDESREDRISAERLAIGSIGAGVMPCNETLTDLDLSNTGLLPMDVNHLLTCSCIVSLRLFNNKLGRPASAGEGGARDLTPAAVGTAGLGIVAASRLLLDHPSLTQLDVSGNDCPEADVAALCGHLLGSAPHGPLRVLLLGGNNVGGVVENLLTQLEEARPELDIARDIPERNGTADNVTVGAAAGMERGNVLGVVASAMESAGWRVGGGALARTGGGAAAVGDGDAGGVESGGGGGGGSTEGFAMSERQAEQEGSEEGESSEEELLDGNNNEQRGMREEQ